MKYFDEEQMAETRKALEKQVFQWSGVTAKGMMGCLCYFRGRKFFAFLVTGGIIINKLSQDDRATLSKVARTEPFRMAGKATRLMKTRLKGPEDVSSVLPFVRKSYENASA